MFASEYFRLSVIVLSLFFDASRMSSDSNESIRNILRRTFSYSSCFAFDISFKTQWFFPWRIISIPISVSVIAETVSIVLCVLPVMGFFATVLLNCSAISSFPLVYADTIACHMSLVLKSVMSIVVFLIASSEVVLIVRLSSSSCSSTSSPFLIPYFFTHLLGRLTTYVLPASCITFLFMIFINAYQIYKFFYII